MVCFCIHNNKVERALSGAKNHPELLDFFLIFIFAATDCSIAANEGMEAKAGAFICATLFVPFYKQQSGLFF